jgi:hypothetical protein
MIPGLGTLVRRRRKIDLNHVRAGTFVGVSDISVSDISVFDISVFDIRQSIATDSPHETHDPFEAPEHLALAEAKNRDALALAMIDDVLPRPLEPVGTHQNREPSFRTVEVQNQIAVDVMAAERRPQYPLLANGAPQPTFCRCEIPATVPRPSEQDFLLPPTHRTMAGPPRGDVSFSFFRLHRILLSEGPPMATPGLCR